MERNSFLLLKDLVTRWEVERDHARRLKEREPDLNYKRQLESEAITLTECIRDLTDIIQKIQEEEARGSHRPG